MNINGIELALLAFSALTLLVGQQEGRLGSYSQKQIVRTIEQCSCDLHRRSDTTYSQNVSQGVIVSSVLLASLMFTFQPKKCHLVGTETFFTYRIIIVIIIMNGLVS